MLKYKNKKFRRSKNTHALEVSCGHCKEAVIVYEKGGQGNLIKMQAPRIIESAVDLVNLKGHLHCPACDELLARKGVYRDRLTYWIVRGQVNTREISGYF